MSVYPQELPRKMVNQFLQLNAGTQSGIYKMLTDVLEGEKAVMGCLTAGIQNSGNGLVDLSEQITDLTLTYTNMGISSSIDIVDAINRLAVDVLMQIAHLIQASFGEAFNGVQDSLTVGVALANDVAGSFYGAGRLVATTLLELSAFATNQVFDMFIQTAKDVQNGCNYGFAVADGAVDSVVGLDQLKPHAKMANQAAQASMVYVTNLAGQVLTMVKDFLNSVFSQSNDIQNQVFDALVQGTGMTFEMFQKVGLMSNGQGMRLSGAFLDFFNNTFNGVLAANALFWNNARQVTALVFDFLNGGKAFAFPAVRTMWNQGHDMVRSSMVFALELIDTGLRGSVGICEDGREFIMSNVDNCIVSIWDLVFRVFGNIWATTLDVSKCANDCFRVTDITNFFRGMDKNFFQIEKKVVAPVFRSVEKADAGITGGMVFTGVRQFSDATGIPGF